MILLRAARKRLGEARVRTGHHLAAVEQLPDGKVRARFVARGTNEQIAVADADLLIAADGIHSTVRAQFYPHEGPPKWNGVLFWRATSRTAPFLTGSEMISLGYPGHRFIAYPISRREAERGRSLINWIAEIGRDPARPFRREDWNRRGNLEEFLPRFDGWMFDWLDVPAIMRAADAIYEYPCVDRDPLDRWTFGRITLLGDAAHPMYPMGSNGASQAILDAKALAQALVLQGDIDRALAAYEAARRPATAEIVLANRRQGPSEIQTIVEQRAPNGFDNIESVLSAAERAAIAEGYQRMAGFDRLSVNTDSAVQVLTESGGKFLRPATVETILRQKGADVATIEPDASIRRAADWLRIKNIGALVVTSGKAVLGLISEREIVHAFSRYGESATSMPVKEIMRYGVITVSPDESVSRVMQLMTRHRIRHMPVLRDGEIAGIISIGDVVKHRLEDLESETNVLRDAYMATH